MPLFLGIDTSNYTTSAALYDSDAKEALSRRLILPVAKGEKGLRQNDAVFLHTKRLPLLIRELTGGKRLALSAVGASDAPERREGSYMPCFLVGAGVASSIADVCGVPLRCFSHQEGHIMAALYSAGRMDLWEKPFWAFHVSGGTTELLQVEPDGQKGRKITVLGGKRDICAGQLIDRTGVMLGLNFPCGKELDALSLKGKSFAPKVSVKDGWCDFSGLENKLRELFKRGGSSEDCARFCIDAVTAALDQIISDVTGGEAKIPLVFTGGVTANTLLREFFKKRPNTFFATAELAGDNAVGAAVLASLMEAEA